MIETISDSDFILPILEPPAPPVERPVGEDDIDKPLVFRLYYNNGGQVENTIYLNDSDPLDLFLELYTLSDKKITFNPLEGQPTTNADQKRSHFYLRFAAELDVDFNQVQVAPSDTWQVNTLKRDKNVFMFFRRRSRLHLNGNERVLLTLKNFTVNNPTVRSTDVTLYYGKHSNLLLVNNEKLDKEINSLKGVTVMQKPPSTYKNNIPLEGRFVGHDTILNDGNTLNQLTLRIFNRALSAASSPILLLEPAKSKFIISFETGDNNSEALTTSTDANLVKITAKEENQWQVDKTSNLVQWTVTPKASQQLGPSIGFDLDIKDLKASQTSGVSYLYIDYENIGDYPAGRLVVPIEKTPLLYRGQQVGIGTNPLVGAKLHIGKVEKGQVGLQVEGPVAETELTIKEILRFVRPRVENQANEDKVSFKIGKFEKQIDGRTQLDIALQDVTVMSLRGNGNVGLGITNPTEKLHIQDGSLRIDNGSIKSYGTIKFYPNTDKSDNEDLIKVLKSNGSEVAMLINHEGKVGIGHDSPSAKLHVNDGDVHISGTGKLGIGTTAPSAKLHVSGDAIVSGKLAIGTTTPTDIHLAIGDNDTGLKQEGDGKLAIYTDGQKRVLINNNGNVGIGTITPSAKLDVNGSVKLGDGSTAWNRIFCGKVIINYDDLSQSKVFGKGISCARYIPPGYPTGSVAPVLGLFKITFEKSVEPEKLVVIVTPQDKDTDNIVNVASVDNFGFTIQVKDSRDKNKENSSFHFIALELTENINKLVTTTLL